MKVVILAGGYGTRISEESHLRPKPMIEIGEHPILWHIMKIYAAFGHTDFIVCCGYKGYVIKEYFANYHLHQSDVTFDFRAGNRLTVHGGAAEPWRVTLVETGVETMTGGRLARVRSYVGDEPFMMTYGDGVADVDLHALLAYHRGHGRLATMTVVQPPGRWGMVEADDEGRVTAFQEKTQGDGGWINGGFFVLEPGVFDHIREGDHTTWEREPLEELARARQLMVMRHRGFWHAMDTLRDRTSLEQLWQERRAPWKVWE